MADRNWPPDLRGQTEAVARMQEALRLGIDHLRDVRLPEPASMQIKFCINCLDALRVALEHPLPRPGGGETGDRASDALVSVAEAGAPATLQLPKQDIGWWC